MINEAMQSKMCPVSLERMLTKNISHALIAIFATFILLILPIQGPPKSSDGKSVVHAYKHPVIIPDRYLRVSIRRASGRHTSIIYTTDLLKIETLYAFGQKCSEPNAIINKITYPLSIANYYRHYVVSLHGIQYLRNLKKLSLSCNRLIDLRPLSRLEKLECLSMAGSRIKNISPLSNLTNLTYLDLSTNPISDIEPLSGLSNLNVLHLSFCEIEDISPLAKLSNLTELRLRNNPIQDFSPLQDKPKLIFLGLGDHVIDDLSFLSKNENIEVLLLTKCNIRDISALSGLKKLRRVSLDDNNISDISPLVENFKAGGIVAGTMIDLSGNPLSENAISEDIPLLRSNGIKVYYED